MEKRRRVMRAKLLEVRVGEEVIPIIALEMRDDTGKDRGWLLENAGYRQDHNAVTRFIMVTLESVQWVPNHIWGKIAWDHIYNGFPGLKDGDVIDVDWILGKIISPRKSKRYDV